MNYTEFDFLSSDELPSTAAPYIREKAQLREQGGGTVQIVGNYAYLFSKGNNPLMNFPVVGDGESGRKELDSGNLVKLWSGVPSVQLWCVKLPKGNEVLVFCNGSLFFRGLTTRVCKTTPQLRRCDLRCFLFAMRDPGAQDSQVFFDANCKYLQKDGPLFAEILRCSDGRVYYIVKDSCDFFVYSSSGELQFRCYQ